MRSNVIEDCVRQFVLNRFPLARQRLLDNDDSFLDNGIIDSLGILELVAFVEKEFGITVSDDELLPDNFESVRCLAAFVERKEDGSK